MPVDYAALAEQARQSGAAKPPVDYEALAAQARTPAPQEQPDFKPPEGSSLSRFAGGLWDTTIGGILGSAKILTDAARAHISGTPVSPETAQALGSIVQAHADQAQKMKDAWGRGDHVEGFGHALASALPVLGPAAAHAGERVEGRPPEFDRYGNVVKQGQ